MSKGQEAMLFIGLIIYFAGALMWIIVKWVDYGIYEKNLLRCVVHSVWTPVWPLALMVYAFQWLRKYAESKFHRDLVELFPAKQAKPLKEPQPIPVSSLGEDGPRYKPGDWVN